MSYLYILYYTHFIFIHLLCSADCMLSLFWLFFSDWTKSATYTIHNILRRTRRIAFFSVYLLISCFLLFFLLTSVETSCRFVAYLHYTHRNGFEIAWLSTIMWIHVELLMEKFFDGETVLNSLTYISLHSVSVTHNKRNRQETVDRCVHTFRFVTHTQPAFFLFAPFAS